MNLISIQNPDGSLMMMNSMNVLKSYLKAV